MSQQGVHMLICIFIYLNLHSDNGPEGQEQQRWYYKGIDGRGLNARGLDEWNCCGVQCPFGYLVHTCLKSHGHRVSFKPSASSPM